MISFLARRAHLGFTLFLFALTSVYLVAAFQIRTQFDEGLVGPKFVPFLAAGIVYAALLRILWQQARQGGELGEGHTLKQPLLVVIATAGYIALFAVTGYVIATILFMIAILWVFEFERARPWLLVGCAALVTGLVYLLFGVAFGIRLPVFPEFL